MAETHPIKTPQSEGGATCPCGHPSHFCRGWNFPNVMSPAHPPVAGRKAICSSPRCVATATRSAIFPTTNCGFSAPSKRPATSNSSSSVRLQTSSRARDASAMVSVPDCGKASCVAPRGNADSCSALSAVGQIEFHPPIATTDATRSQLAGGSNSSWSNCTSAWASSIVTGLGVVVMLYGLLCTRTSRRSNAGPVPSVPVNVRKAQCSTEIGSGHSHSLQLRSAGSCCNPECKRPAIWKEPPPLSHAAANGSSISPLRASAVASPSRASASCAIVEILRPVCCVIFWRKAAPLGAFLKTSVAMPHASTAPSSVAIAVSSVSSLSPSRMIPSDKRPSGDCCASTL
mmetsp:Transcript_6703/g.14606  ORF Transcript_6703/g.14606 Transcript_6703/m.14606 type:complete len:344 (-) Transcript_6703:222-1253(-)